MITEHQPPRIEPSKRAAIVLLVVLLHLLLLYWLAMIRASAPSAEPLIPPVEVWLFPSGGGSPASDRDAAVVLTAPSSSSTLHVPPRPAPWPETLAAPPEPGPTDSPGSDSSTPATLPVAGEGIETSETATTGSGDASGSRGGGSGDGSGVGSGSGSGRGRGSGAVLIRGPAGATISQNVSPAALAVLPGSYAVLRCQIRLNGRLENCSVRGEHPQGSGVGQAAIARAGEFRFRPPRVGSRYRDRHRITVAIAFPPSPDDNGEP